MDVFFKEIIGLPLKRKIKFVIYLILETGNVSIATYQITPAVLVVLKKQIKDLLEKQVI